MNFEEEYVGGAGDRVDAALFAFLVPVLGDDDRVQGKEDGDQGDGQA
ncbi:hypothetical protein [Streptomyces sp. NPDC059957]